jgi:hypothetical protein
MPSVGGVLEVDPVDALGAEGGAVFGVAVAVGVGFDWVVAEGDAGGAVVAEVAVTAADAGAPAATAPTTSHALTTNALTAMPERTDEVMDLPVPPAHTW